MYFTWRS